MYGVTPYNESNATATGDYCKREAFKVSCDDNITSTKLSDGVTGVPLHSLNDNNLRLFFAFSRFSGSDHGSRISTGFLINPPIAVTIYFYNSPQDYIGLPNITILQTIYKPLVPYTLSDNFHDLSTQNNSHIADVTLYFSRPLNGLQIEITFPDESHVKWFLVSEMVFLYDGK